MVMEICEVTSRAAVHFRFTVEGHEKPSAAVGMLAVAVRHNTAVRSVVCLSIVVPLKFVSDVRGMLSVINPLNTTPTIGEHIGRFAG